MPYWVEAGLDYNQTMWNAEEENVGDEDQVSANVPNNVVVAIVF